MNQLDLSRVKTFTTLQAILLPPSLSFIVHIVDIHWRFYISNLSPSVSWAHCDAVLRLYFWFSPLEKCASVWCGGDRLSFGAALILFSTQTTCIISSQTLDGIVSATVTSGAICDQDNNKLYFYFDCAQWILLLTLGKPLLWMLLNTSLRRLWLYFLKLNLKLRVFLLLVSFFFCSNLIFKLPLSEIDKLSRLLKTTLLKISDLIKTKLFLKQLLDRQQKFFSFFLFVF